jgi:BirA family biotin operon repressor/biotin-[acetyl-CoA-carboxylase] ligase
VSRVSPIEPDARGRDPLRADALRGAVLAPGRLWSRLDVVEQTGSTNDDLLAAARTGAAEGAVLAAEHQTRGRGRLGRAWTARTGSALTFSMLLRPGQVPAASLGWLPLLTGVALVSALTEAAAVDAVLKWPNDVLAGEAKLAGILAEQTGRAVVVGAGVNIGAAREELPPTRPGALPATSLALLGAASLDREALLEAILAEFERWYLRWTRPVPGDAEGSGLRAEYLRRCATIGRDVRVELPGGTVLAGRASGIDAVGRLLVDTPAGREAVSAGDVIHLR